jgi:hypothetical protein
MSTPTAGCSMLPVIVLMGVSRVNGHEQKVNKDDH